jgi:hypothetical protein
MIALAPEFDRDELAVLDAIATGSTPWSSRKAISQRAHLRAVKILDGLVGRGMLERWSTDSHGRKLKLEVWTLTAWGACRLDVRIEEVKDFRPRWHAGTEPIDALPLRCSSHRHEVRIGARAFATIPDRRVPEFLADVETGELTADEGQAAKLWGIPLRKRPGKAARGPATRPRRPG